MVLSHRDMLSGPRHRQVESSGAEIGERARNLNLPFRWKVYNMPWLPKKSRYPHLLDEALCKPPIEISIITTTIQTAPTPTPTTVTGLVVVDKHAGHDPEVFRRLFWWNLVLVVPVLVFSDQIQEWFDYSIDGAWGRVGRSVGGNSRLPVGRQAVPGGGCG